HVGVPTTRLWHPERTSAQPGWLSGVTPRQQAAAGALAYKQRRVRCTACAVAARQTGGSMGDENMKEQWPHQLWIVRHGQSAGNVARDAAEAAGQALIDIEFRDIDTPLSELGVRQSLALGRWFGQLPPAQRPEVILCSPYVRARDTARHLMEEARLRPGRDVRLRVDERLREKEFGVLDRLTKFGIQQKYPELDAQRRHVGKFYFRPPGGESWCDVILRLRSTLETITREHRRERVLIVSHQVIVNCFRYLLERLDE